MNMSPIEADAASADALPRLHALLVDAVRRRRGMDPYQVPVTVAEIYQDLVPYRAVRAALGVDMNADYEHMLLRLLSGEGDLARIEPATARDQIARELESANPNVALYRKFAACDVWLMPTASHDTPDWLTEHLAEEALQARARSAASAEEAPSPITADEEPEPELELDDTMAQMEWQDEETPEALEATSPVTTPRNAAPRTFTVAEDVEREELAAPEPVVPSATQQGRCAFCDSALPRGRTARFCPYCGADQAQRPCSSCGEAVEAGWAFCIACGQPADAEEA